MRLLLIIISLLGTACVGQKAVVIGKSENTQQEPRKLQLLFKDNYSGVEQTEFHVVRNSKVLKDIFIQINSNRKPGLPVPEVNFTKELLVVYYPGTSRGVGIWELFFEKESLDTVFIGLKEQTTSKKEPLNVTTTPIYIYKMPLTEKNIIPSKKY